MGRDKLSPRQIETALRDYALGFPEATEDFPWGERAIKVKGKVFLADALRTWEARMGERALP
jgi:hypothetical protein